MTRIEILDLMIEIIKYCQKIHMTPDDITDENLIDVLHKLKEKSEGE